MHELAVTRSILDEIRRVAEKESIRPTFAKVSVGELTTFKPDPIRYYAGVLTENDAFLKGIELDVRIVEGRIRCEACGAEGLVASELALACADCASFNVSITQGNDVIVETLRGHDV